MKLDDQFENNHFLFLIGSFNIKFINSALITEAEFDSVIMAECCDIATFYSVENASTCVQIHLQFLLMLSTLIIT